MARAGGLPLPTITDDRALGGTDIQRSLRFNDDDGAFLSRTPSSAGNRKTWTWSAWIKRANIGSRQILFSADDNATHATYFLLELQSDDNLRCLAGQETASATCVKETAAVIRDSTNWYHLVFKFDAANTSAVWYINGQEITDLNSSTDPSNQDFQVNATTQHFLGRFGSSLGTSYFDGYMAEVNFVDGYAYDASYFGFTDSQTGIWLPKRYEGAYGTNGFYLDFSDNSSTTTLGIDKSPNGNDFTLNNFSVSAGVDNDSFTYTPTNQNFPTFESLYTSQQGGGSVTYSEGNLKIATSASGSNYARYPFAMSSPHLAVNSGKWYAEFKCNSTKCAFGVCNTGQLDSDMTNNPYGAAARTSIIYTSEGQLRGNNSDIRNGNGSFTTNDIIGIALDLDNMKIYFHKNGTYINSGNPNTGANPDTVQDLQVNNSGGYIFQAGSDGQNNITASANFGQHAFSYSIPTGYKTLTSNKLPDNVPSIINPKQNFAAITYTGAGSNTNITGLLFEPGLIWCKSRTQAYSHYIFDKVRGFGGNNLKPNSSDAEGSDATSISSTHVSGFYIGAASGISDTYQAPNNNVAWCWKAGGAAVTNNDGNTTSQVSVNQEAGFSIVTYAGSGQPRTIGHGLGKKPAWIMTKSRDDTDNWMVWHQNIHTSNIGNYSIPLNTTDGRDNASQYWYDTEPTSTVFTRGNYSEGDDMIAYCWAEIPGFSKFGQYKGNGNVDGAYVPLGFRPAWLMTRRIDSGDHWIIRDSARNTDNQVYSILNPNSNSVEFGSRGHVQNVDFLANGFKITGTDSGHNGSTGTYIYIAFAEQPGTTPFDTFPNAR